MKVFLVMGEPHSGKTTFIENTLPKTPHRFDVLDVQSMFREQWMDEESRDFIAMILMGSIKKMLYQAKKDDTDYIIIEFVGTIAEERAAVVKTVNDFLNADIYGYYIETDAKTLEIRKEQSIKHYAFNMSCTKTLPSLEEGFDNLYFVQSVGVKTKKEQIIEQACFHVGYDGSSENEAYDLLRQWMEGQLDVEQYPYAGELARNMKREGL